MVQKLSLDKGYYALVDDEDYEDLVIFPWRITKGGNNRTYYARRHWYDNGKLCQEYMHTRITGYKFTDHINGDSLDNRRCNLREATRSQNGANRSKFTGSYSSQYKGVSWYKNSKKWVAQINFQQKIMNLGYYFDEIEAARVYDRAALKYFGEFAYLNFDRSDYI